MTIPKPPLTPEEREHKTPEEIERQERTPEDDPMTGEELGHETSDEGDARGGNVDDVNETVRD